MFRSSLALTRGLRAMSTHCRRLDGRVAIVTASTDGIGLGIAQRLAKEGAKVVISSRKQPRVDAAVQELKGQGLQVEGIVCHVGKGDQRKALLDFTLEKFGKLDILVSNAAVNPVYGPTLDTPEEAWDKIFEINVKAAFLLSQLCMPHLEKSGHGSLIFISSIAGLNPLPALGPYSVSKTALLGLTKVLATECGPKNVRVNAIAPGIIKTTFSKELYEDPKAQAAILRQVPLKRLGETGDCAGVAAFLASDDAAYVTGETIVTAGGMVSRL